VDAPLVEFSLAFETGMQVVWYINH
jgi:hypothetical protein